MRENLKHGATQIKIMGGGGVASDYDPIHTLQPAPEEVRAAVQAASDWGTYVTAHSYTAPAIRRLVENGVRMIEHGLLIDDETARLCAEKGVVISTQVAIFRLGTEAMEGSSEENRRKMEQVRAGQDRLIALMKKYDLTVGFGSDLVFGSLDLLGKEFTLRADYFSPAEILRQATSESGEIIRMAGPLDRHGDFGEIREGWLADLLIPRRRPPRRHRGAGEPGASGRLRDEGGGSLQERAARRFDRVDAQSVLRSTSIGSRGRVRASPRSSIQARRLEGSTARPIRRHRRTANRRPGARPGSL